MTHVEVCPLCHSRDQRFFESVEEGDLTVRYRVCRRCGLVFQTPRISDQELEAFYTQGYRAMIQGVEGPVDKDVAAQLARARDQARLLEDHVTHVRRLLDVGSSSGALLEVFRERFGCEAVGIEPGEVYRLFSRSRGLRVYASLEELNAAGEERFDLISFSHVLEHVADPVGYLRETRERCLAHDGTTLVEVPNLFEHQSLELMHLIAFSPATLRETLHAAGFDVGFLSAHGGFRSRTLRLYVTALARPARHPRRVGAVAGSWRGVVLGRRLGMLKARLLSRLLPSITWRPPSEQHSRWPGIRSVVMASAVSLGTLLGTASVPVQECLSCTA